MWTYSTFYIPEDFMVSYRGRREEKNHRKNVNKKCHSADHLMLFVKAIVCQKSHTFLSKVFSPSSLNGMPRDVHSAF